MHGVFSQYMVLMLFVLSFFGLGALLFKMSKTNIANSVNHFFYASLTGCATAIIFFSIAYLVGNYSIYAVYLLYLCSIPGLFFFIKRFDKNLAVLLTTVLLLLFRQIVYTLVPPSTFDDTMYHLPIIEKIISNQVLDFTTNIRYPTYPFFGEVFLSLGMPFGDIGAQLISCYALLLIGIGVGKEFIDNSYWKSIAAIFLLLRIGALASVSSIAYIDTILALFIFSTFMAMKNIIYDQCNLPMTFPGVFIGIAIGTKYSAGLFALEFGLFLVFLRNWKQVVQYAVPGVLIGGIWYLRNYFIVGNPVWPFAAKYFNTANVWSAQDYQYQFADLFRKSTTFREAFDKIQHSEGGIPIIIILGTLLYFFVARKKPEMKFYFWCVIPYLVFWYNSAQFVRYLVPIIPVICLMAAIAYVTMIDQFSRKKMAIGLFMIVVIRSYVLVPHLSYHDFNAVVTDPKGYLESRQAGYSAIDYASKLPGKTYAMYSFERFNYYGRDQVYGDHFGTYRYRDVEVFIQNNDYLGLKTHLNQIGMRYFLVSVKLKLNENEHLQSIYHDQHAIIYELK